MSDKYLSMLSRANEGSEAAADWAIMWNGVYAAAKQAGHPDPHASADRYMQGWELREQLHATS